MNPVDDEAQPIETQTASTTIDGPALIEDDEAQQTQARASTIKVEYANKAAPTTANNVQSKTQKVRKPHHLLFSSIELIKTFISCRIDHRRALVAKQRTNLMTPTRYSTLSKRKWLIHVLLCPFPRRVSLVLYALYPTISTPQPVSIKFFC